MKKTTKSFLQYINLIHAYPYWVFLLFMYGSIALFVGSALLSFMPDTRLPSTLSTLSPGLLFECAIGFLVVGGITAPIMDLILRIDLKEQ